MAENLQSTANAPLTRGMVIDKYIPLAYPIAQAAHVLLMTVTIVSFFMGMFLSTLKEFPPETTSLYWLLGAIGIPLVLLARANHRAIYRQARATALKNGETLHPSASRDP